MTNERILFLFFVKGGAAVFSRPAREARFVAFRLVRRAQWLAAGSPALRRRSACASAHSYAAGRKRYVDLRKQCVRALSCCKAVAGVSGGVLEHDCGAADAGACNLGKFGALNWYVDAGRVLLQAFFIRAL